MYLYQQTSNFLPDVLDLCRTLIGSTSTWSLQLLGGLGTPERSEDLRKGLSTFQSHHLADAVQPPSDHRVELRAVLSLQRGPAASPFLPSIEARASIREMQSQYEEITGMRLGTSGSNSQSVNLPRVLVKSEVEALPLSVLRERLRAVTMESKILKQVKREKAKEADALAASSLAPVGSESEPNSPKSPSSGSPSVRRSYRKVLKGSADMHRKSSTHISHIEHVERRRKRGESTNFHRSAIVPLFSDLQGRLKFHKSTHLQKDNSTLFSHTVSISCDNLSRQERERKESGTPQVDSETGEPIPELWASPTEVPRSVSMQNIKKNSDSDLGPSLSARASESSHVALSRFVNSDQEQKIPPKHRSLICKCNGLWLEDGSESSRRERALSFSEIGEENSIGEWYSDFFYDQEHTNYASRVAPEGDVVISVRRELEEGNPNSTLLRALYRSAETTTGILIPSSQLRTGLIRGKTTTLDVSASLIASDLISKTPRASSNSSIHFCGSSHSPLVLENWIKTF